MLLLRTDSDYTYITANTRVVYRLGSRYLRAWLYSVYELIKASHDSCRADEETRMSIVHADVCDLYCLDTQCIRQAGQTVTVQGWPLPVGKSLGHYHRQYGV